MVRLSVVSTVLFLVIAASSSIVNAQEQPGGVECTLDCPTNAPCKFGSADFSGHQFLNNNNNNNNNLHHINGMHCHCPPSWTGVKCNVIFESCVTGDQQGGGHHCYHGGACKVGLEDAFGNMQMYCDCTHAIGYDGTSYAGKYCETPLTIHDTITMPEEDDDEVAVVPDEESPMEDVTTPRPNLPLDPPQGEECGNKTCYNGGQCVSTTIKLDNGERETYQDCDCSMAFDDDHLYAGSSCQYKSTSLCSRPDEEDGGGWLEGSIGCFNYGLCKENNICDCPEGFAGRYCEYELITHVPTVDQDDDLVDDDTASMLLNDDEENDDDDDDTEITEIVYYEDDDDTEDNDDDDDDVGKLIGDFEKCGDHHCFYGTCQSFTVNDKEEHECECFTTDTDLYAGTNCQYRSTSICEEPDPVTGLLGISFCVNGGLCRDDPNDGCDCPPGYTGLRCEFTRLDDRDDDDDDGMLIGDLEICGDHYCIGAKCITTTFYLENEETQTFQDCDGDGIKYPLTTDICTIGDPRPGQSLYYCMQGICLDQVTADEPHPGCACMDGWTGESCDVLTNPSSPVDRALIMIVFVIAGTTIFSLALIAYCIRARSDPSSFQCLRLRRRRRRRQRKDGERTNLVKTISGKNKSSNDDMSDMAVSSSASMPSSRDPFVARLAFNPNDPAEISPTHSSGSSNDDIDDHDEEPRIFIPPVDEDNHRLHDVNII